MRILWRLVEKTVLDRVRNENIQMRSGRRCQVEKAKSDTVATTYKEWMIVVSSSCTKEHPEAPVPLVAYLKDERIRGSRLYKKPAENSN